jgi:stage V sporulation protein B
VLGEGVSTAENPAASKIADALILAKGAVIAMLGSVLSIILGMGNQIAMARFLGTAAFGLFSIVWTLIRMLSIISPLGMPIAVIYYGARYRWQNPSKFRGVLLQSIGMSLLSGIVVSVLVYIGAPFIGIRIFGKPEATDAIRWFSPAFALLPTLLTALPSTNITKKIKYAVYSDLANQGSNLVIFLLFVWAGARLFGAVEASILSILVGLGVSGYYIWRLYPDAFTPGLRQSIVVGELLSYSLPVALAGVAISLSAFMDRFFVGSYCSASEMGAYQAASQIALLFAMIWAALASIFEPMIADMHHRGERERIQELLKVGSKWGMYLGAPLFLAIAFDPVGIIRMLYGAGYEGSASALLILSAGQLIGLVTGPVSTMLALTGNKQAFVCISLLAFAVELALSAILVPRYGMRGAAIAASSSYLVLHLGALVTINYSEQIWSHDYRHVKPAIATGTSLIILICTYKHVNQFYLGPILIIFLSFGLFVTSSILLGLDDEDLQILHSLRLFFCHQKRRI